MAARTRFNAEKRPSIIRPTAEQQHSESVPVDNMANATPQIDNLPSPGTFSGKSTDNGLEFLQRFELWANYRNLNEAGRLNAFALLLRDSASLWFRVLPDDCKDTWGHLRQNFNQRFGLNPHTNYQRASALWSMTQNTDEPVLNFIERLRLAASEVNVPDEQLRFLIINGVRPGIRQHVIKSNPADLQALIDAAVLAEQSEIVVPNASVVDGIARLERQLANMQVTAVSRGPKNGQAPRRFNDRAASPSFRGAPTYYRRPAQSPGRQMNRRFESFHDRRVHFDSTTHNNNRPRSPTPTPPFRTGNYRSQPIVCYGCGRIGHVIRNCRSTWNAGPSSYRH